MSTDSMIGSIVMFAGNFAPRGYSLCQGQLLPISQNPALFSILGTTYGGNGQTTFALPDLRGRSPINAGPGPGLSNIDLGEQGGTEYVTLAAGNLPSHNHTVGCDGGGSSSLNPTANIPGLSDDRTTSVTVYSANAPNATMNQLMINVAGNSVPFSNANPFLGINFIICTQGLFPSRN